MSLIQPPSLSDIAKLAKREAVVEVAEALNHAIATLSNVTSRFWNRNDEELLAVLNDNVEETIATLSMSAELAAHLNAWQDAAGVTDANGNLRFPLRAPTERPRMDVIFNTESGKFEII